MKKLFLLLALVFSYSLVFAQKPRGRDLGIPFSGTPGPFNAISDVQGVGVGHSTIIAGQGENKLGKGPV